MEVSQLQENHSVLYCYYSGDVLCIKEIRATSVSVILYLFAAVVVMLTFFGNLVVIISISHFKQLHTPTNILVLSLAVADFFVGLFIMPFMVIQSIETCWYFGNIFCLIYTMLLYILTETSIFNLVMIAIDRYLALCDPLLYSTKITVRVATFSVGLIWFLSLCYTCALLFSNGNTEGIIGLDPCPGDCLVVLNSTWGTLDLVCSFLLPVSIMITLYAKIFVVAKRHIRAISTQQKVFTEKSRNKLAKKSERKAAKTLAIVVAVFILCWLPFYISTILNQFLNLSIPSTIACGFLWLAYINSSLNPIIYAFFYPWFQKSLKLMVTFKIFSTGSSLISLLPEN
ncbi:trace amine-associated receptor 13c-like [Erpetoichthys calabaricus]|uniref:trace amine-associated receptor 13c-like n=1 Tax=Erpetoichthys calabaricus TaxID=27687 RepID=UPI002234D66B|nr:trace amine-associated receptor 13c-like [Erpetoichthys calabaricus]